MLLFQLCSRIHSTIFMKISTGPATLSCNVGPGIVSVIGLHNSIQSIIMSSFLSVLKLIHFRWRQSKNIESLSICNIIDILTFLDQVDMDQP